MIVKIGKVEFNCDEIEIDFSKPEEFSPGSFFSTKKYSPLNFEKITKEKLSSEGALPTYIKFKVDNKFYSKLNEIKDPEILLVQGKSKTLKFYDAYILRLDKIEDSNECCCEFIFNSYKLE